MIESVIAFFEAMQYGRHAAVFLLSMFPGIGLSLMIPVGVGLGLPVLTSAGLSILGNTLPVPIIIIFVSKVFGWMRKKSARLGRISDKFEAKAQKYGGRLQRGEFIGLFIFVAVPIPFIPGTGAWTGALIAGVLGVRLKTAVPAIALGTLVSGFIVAVVTFGFASLLR